MDKTLVLAVAGSGKTESIIRRLTPGVRTLILTYTHNAEVDLRRRVLARYGHMPAEIRIATYFSFLDRFCARPLLQAILRTQGVSYDDPPEFSRRLPLNDERRYLDRRRRIYYCRLAKFLQMQCLDELVGRLERYFDCVVIDEAQDFAGYDFDFLLELSKARVEWYMVGDFYQHTFDTSRDGAINKNLHADIETYCQRFIRAGFQVDRDRLKGSRRCSQDVCDFIRENLGIAIESAAEKRSEVTVVRSRTQASDLFADADVLKLFYQEHYRYRCSSLNWGAAKGLDHCRDVCVVLNKSSWKDFEHTRLPGCAPQTRNKLYVASSRPHRHLFVMDEALVAALKSPRQTKRQATAESAF